MPDHYTALDNPAWHALTETHALFATGTDSLKRYDPSIVLFAGYDLQVPGIAKQFDAVFAAGDSFFLFDTLPALPANYQVETVVECLQMICEKPVPAMISEALIKLAETHRQEMYELVMEVFPGYYLPGTAAMGDYYGIFNEGRLVAMAGERLCMTRFTEISAVVTHPAFGGRGYAQQLVSHLNDKNIRAGKIPFLHTGSGNQRAIGVYELLGYSKRRIIPVTRVKRLI